MLKPLTIWITANWKILKEMGIPDHLTCLLRNLYAGQEATARIGHEQWTGSKLRKEYVKAVYCHPAYSTYMQSTSCKMPGWMKLNLESRLIESVQSGIKISRRNINNIRHAYDITLMEERGEELKSLLMKMKEESEKGGSTLNKTKIMTSSPITSWHIDGKTMETVTDFIFSGSKITAYGDYSHEI